MRLALREVSERFNSETSQTPEPRAAFTKAVTVRILVAAATAASVAALAVAIPAGAIAAAAVPFIVASPCLLAYEPLRRRPLGQPPRNRRGGHR